MPHPPDEGKAGRGDKNECGSFRGMGQSLEGTCWDFQVLVSRKKALDQGRMDSSRNRQFIKEEKDTTRM